MFNYHFGDESCVTGRLNILLEIILREYSKMEFEHYLRKREFNKKIPL